MGLLGTDDKLFMTLHFLFMLSIFISQVGGSYSAAIEICVMPHYHRKVDYFPIMSRNWCISLIPQQLTNADAFLLVRGKFFIIQFCSINFNG